MPTPTSNLPDLLGLQQDVALLRDELRQDLVFVSLPTVRRFGSVSVGFVLKNAAVRLHVGLSVKFCWFGSLGMRGFGCEDLDCGLGMQGRVLAFGVFCGLLLGSMLLDPSEVLLNPKRLGFWV